MQNPVTTLFWLIACVQIMTPAFSFAVDCKLHSKWNWPEMLVQGSYIFVIVLTWFLGPQRIFDAYWGFADLPFSFRVKGAVINIIGAIGYLTFLSVTRRLLAQHTLRNKVAVAQT